MNFSKAFVCYFILGISGLALNGVASLREEGGPSLLDDAIRAREACDQYFAETESLEGGFSKKEIFPSKELTLKALALAEQYPEYPKSSSDILHYLESLPDDSGQNPDVGTILAATSNCEAARFYGTLSRLLRSGQKYHLAPGEKNRIAKLILRHLQADLEGDRTPFEFALDQKILADALAKGFLRETGSAGKLERDSFSSPELEIAQSILASPPGSNAFRDANLNILRDLKKELGQARLLQEELRGKLTRITAESSGKVQEK